MRDFKGYTSREIKELVEACIVELTSRGWEVYANEDAVIILTKTTEIE